MHSGTTGSLVGGAGDTVAKHRASKRAMSAAKVKGTSAIVVQRHGLKFRLDESPVAAATTLEVTGGGPVPLVVSFRLFMVQNYYCAGRSSGSTRQLKDKTTFWSIHEKWLQVQ